MTVAAEAPASATSRGPASHAKDQDGPKTNDTRTDGPRHKATDPERHGQPVTTPVSEANGHVPDGRHSLAGKAKIKTEAAIRFAKQAEQLSLLSHDENSDEARRTTAVAARFITPRDPVIETASGDRLPAVPLTEAQRLNQLKNEVAVVGLGDEGITSEDHTTGEKEPNPRCVSEDRMSIGLSEQKSLEKTNEEMAPVYHEQDRAEKESDSIEGTTERHGSIEHADAKGYGRTGGPLKSSVPPSRTNPLFPPLPLYGPPSMLRNLQCRVLRFTSFFLSLGFLMVIVLGSAFTSLPLMFQHIGIRLKGQDPNKRRPFYEEEQRRAAARKQADTNWRQKKRRRASFSVGGDKDNEDDGGFEDFVPTEGGKDPLQCDAAYYARRVGLDLEEFKVQTEDGFIITLWHVYNPREYMPATTAELQAMKPEVFPDIEYNPDDSPCSGRRRNGAPKRYPVLLIHGLLQSAGAYCSNDDASLAFYLAKSGYDVWLGNNRCGFRPEHTLLSYGDPRLWCFNIRQMGVLDLPALISRVLTETGFPQLGLVCHSQGTTETFVALAKEQRPDLGQHISVFCALAPAVYAGPLIGKMYFKFMHVISPVMFRIFFGIHAFIPFMMTMQYYLPGRLYGAMGYRVFSFLFNWSDSRWDRGLRNRMFRFAPVYVSAESMRWWLGRECFAKHKCILATREEARQEDQEDAQEDDSDVEDPDLSPEELGRRAWYDASAPPMALWIAGSDELVDGRRLLRRFARGREPHVRIVHSKVIDEYEHLDVLWAMDVIEQVGTELRTVLWQTCQHRLGCAVPQGCDEEK